MKESFERFDTVEVVGDGCRFATTVHCQQWVAHIDTTDRKRRGKDVAKRAAASYITMIHKTLTVYACLLANPCKDSC